MNIKGQIQMSTVAITALAFVIILSIFGQFLSITTGILQPNSNVFISTGFNSGIINLLNLLPLVLVGAFLILIVVLAFRFTR